MPPTDVAATMQQGELRPRLRATVSRVLDWIDEHLTSFDPREPEWLFDDQRAKQFIELAVIAGLCVEYGYPRSDRRLARVGELVVDVSRRPEFRHRIIRFPAEFILFLDVYGAVLRFGYRDAELFELLRRVVDHGLFRHMERIPHQEMELRLALESAHLPAPVSTRATAARASLVAREPCPLYLADTAIYELTHTIMFHEGYGIREPDQPISGDIAGLRTLLAHLIVMKCREGHWDLLAELLYCWDCLRLPLIPVTHAAWISLLDAQKGCGGFSYRSTASSSANSMPSAGSGSFQALYHTTLVALLACALKLHRFESPLDR